MLNSGAILSCGLILQLIDPVGSLAETYDFIKQYIQVCHSALQIGVRGTFCARPMFF